MLRIDSSEVPRYYRIILKEDGVAYHNEVCVLDENELARLKGALSDKWPRPFDEGYTWEVHPA